MSSELWRQKVWCQEHRALQVVDTVRSARPYLGPNKAAMQALVTLPCGEQVSIITTARNVRMMRGETADETALVPA